MKPHITRLTKLPGQKELWLCKYKHSLVGVGNSPAEAYKAWFHANKSVYGSASQ